MAKSVNSVTILGNVGQAPQQKDSPNGTRRTMVSIATNERKKDGDKWVDHVEWHSVVLFGKLAEVAAQFLRKGSKVYIEGHLRTVSWDDDKGRHWKTNIVADELILCDRPDDGRQSEPPVEAYNGAF